jgi:D-alanine-D-alanine ligase
MGMSKEKKTRLCIVFGGRSGEHEISIRSAASVIAALSPDEYEISVIAITKTGRLATPNEVKHMLPPQVLDRVQARLSLEAGSAGTLMTQGSHEAQNLHEQPEMVFPLLHGPYGEDGTIQGLFEIAGIPYVGCGVLASAVGMDKDIMKKLFMQAGLPVPPYIAVLANEAAKHLNTLKKSASEELGYPMFSKPANLGSSVGIRKIHSEKEFEEAFLYSAQFDRKVLIEKGIDAREIECAILGNDDAQASVAGEILPANEFYDYDAKYTSSESRLEIPAQIGVEKTKEVQNMALRSFKAIDGAGLARVDFFLERKTDRIWINEINTMPGFTPISMYSKLWAASGVSFEELVRRLVRLGTERYRERNEKRISAI